MENFFYYSKPCEDLARCGLEDKKKRIFYQLKMPLVWLLACPVMVDHPADYAEGTNARTADILPVWQGTFYTYTRHWHWLLYVRNAFSPASILPH